MKLVLGRVLMNRIVIWRAMKKMGRVRNKRQSGGGERLLGITKWLRWI